MRRRFWAAMAGGWFLLQGGFVLAQSSLDTLDQELKEAQQKHDEVTSKTLDYFFSQVDAAMASPDAALALYQQAGGTMPPTAPVITSHTDETFSEKEARQAIDQANLAKLGTALQLHCGLLHFGALFVVKPDQKGLQDAWIAWLKTAAASYPQLAAVSPAASQPQDQGHHHRNGNGGDNGGGNGSGSYSPSDIKGKTLKDSPITKYLAFNIWGDKEQGKWSVQQLPSLYHTNVLDPSRTTPTATTLANWDAYIEMLNADTTDNDQWNQVVYPPLQFERACDDYTLAPDTEKLEGLVNLIKANPTFPDVSKWIDRVKGMMAAYRASHGGGGASTSAPPPPAPTGNAALTNSNVSVTTQQQGDMTIITTRTNAAPATPSSPTVR